MQHRPIAFIGPMGSGKSRVAASLARRLDRPCLDLDAEVENRAGQTIAAIFADAGEARFRELESAALRDVLANDDTVIATGGGVVLAATNREALNARATVIWLRADVATRLERMRDERAQRPLLHGDDAATTLGKLDAIRTPLYRELADFEMDTSDMSVDEVVDRLMQLLEQREAAA
ncbi:shikimate kinase [Solilutibacter silvestris]|uniref:shikimate kinase n=1 Tax=Solilutibacter silvestris TaxID=1645665 RepID=UPI003D3550BC